MHGLQDLRKVQKGIYTFVCILEKPTVRIYLARRQGK